jgi:hypothetical protein
MIVLVGNFNPAIFQPTWIADQGLIRPQEAQGAKIQIIHPEITQFTAGWLSLQVNRDRLQADSTDSNAHELVRDFVVGTFRLLEHTPITAAGLNHAFHYEIPSHEYNVRLGSQIVPSEAWPMLNNPFFTNLQITSERTDERAGALNVQVQPSSLVEDGLFVAVNDHFDLQKGAKPVPASHAVQLVTESWDASRERAEEIVNGLFERA